MTPRVTSPYVDVIAREGNHLGWLLTQCSRSYDQVFFIFSNNRVEVIARDPQEDLMLKIRLIGLHPVERRTGSLNVQVDANALRAAISCLSESTDLRLRFLQDHIEISSPTDEQIRFNVRAMAAKSTSKGTKYFHRLFLPKNALLVLTKASRVFPDMVKIEFSRKDLKIFELPPSGRLLLSININDGKGSQAETIVASRYLRMMSEILRKANARSVIVSIEKDKPIRVAFEFSELASVIFTFPRESMEDAVGREVAKRQIPPDFNTCPIVQLISFVGARASGTDPLLIAHSGLDTPSSLNLTQAQQLGLVSRDNRRIALTNEGRQLINLLRAETASAKAYLHELGLRRNSLYRRVLSMLTASPVSLEELKANMTRSTKSPISHEALDETISSLIGMASWCGVVTRKLDLVYSLKPQLIPSAQA